MKNIFTILCMLSLITAGDERIVLSIGGSNQKVHDIYFKFEEEGDGLIEVSIDQISSRSSDFLFNIQDPNYLDYLKWLTKLSNAEMRGFDANLKIFDDDIDIRSSIERVLLEIKDIDIEIDPQDEKIDINSVDIKYSLSNFEFFAPFVNDSDVDEVLNTANKLIPDGKITKMELTAKYKKSNNILKINGVLRMISGSGILNIDILINEQSADLSYINNMSLKLNNVAESLVEYIDKLEESSSITIDRLGRGSFDLSYSGPTKELFSKTYLSESYSLEARTVMLNANNASKMYYQTKGSWPVDIEQLERAGMLDIERSIKLRWSFDLKSPDKIIAISTNEMKGGSGKMVIFDALMGRFYGYGSEEDSNTYDNRSDDYLTNNVGDKVCIDTKFGLIKLELFPDIAPKHVESFITHVKNGYYDGTKFHRVIPGFMIQGGDPLTRFDDRSKHGTGGHAGVYFGIGEKSKKETWDIPAEFGSIPHERGILSMARSQSPNSAGSQFFICVADARFLDNQYTVFGKVLTGMDVVDKIVNLSRDAKDNPFEDVKIKTIFCK